MPIPIAVAIGARLDADREQGIANEAVLFCDVQVNIVQQRQKNNPLPFSRSPPVHLGKRLQGQRPTTNLAPL
jgi:hypothetical protein